MKQTIYDCWKCRHHNSGNVYGIDYCERHETRCSFAVDNCDDFEEDPDDFDWQGKRLDQYEKAMKGGITALIALVILLAVCTLVAWIF